MEQLLTIAALDQTTTEWIEQEARRTGHSVDAVVRRLIYRGLEVERRTGDQRHHDLDELAGTWSDTEVQEFQQAVAALDQIDPKLWQ